jgi:hypothetical protein
MIAARLRTTQEVIKRIDPGRGQLTFKLLEGEDGRRIDAELIPEEWQPMNAGVPTIKFASTLNYNTQPGGFDGHVDYSPILPYDGPLTLKWYKDVVAISSRHGFDSFLGGHAFAKHTVLVHMILFDRTREDPIVKAKSLWHDLAAQAKKYGLTNYRTHLDYMGE